MTVPAPLSPRALYGVMISTAVAVVVVVVLWVYPGVLVPRPNCPSHFEASGRDYCAETVSVWPRVSGPGGPAIGCQVGVHFQGDLFAFVLDSNGSVDSLATLGGWLTNPTNNCTTFVLYGDPLGPPSVNWTSSDGSAAIVWSAPYLVNHDGTVVANVTIGVYLG